MGSAARNPLIDRYYSPLATAPDLDEYLRDVTEKRQAAITALEDKLARARQAHRKEEIREIEALLCELRQQP
jgi:hypothetical protein